MKNSYLAAVLIVLISLLIFKSNSVNFKALGTASESSSSGKLAETISTPTPNPTPSPVFVGRSINVPILYFHYIGLNPNPEDKARGALSIAPDTFDSEMGYLSRSGYTPISFDVLYASLKGAASLPPKPIILSFDDGYIDFYVNAFPILQKYHFHSVVFIPTGLVGKSYYMDWPQIKTLDTSGLVSVQAHSVTHPNLPSLSDQQINSEIQESKRVLENQLGKSVNFFAYPYGASDTRIRLAVKNGGFLGAVGTWPGRTETEGGIYNMPRMRVSGAWNAAEFTSHLGL